MRTELVRFSSLPDNITVSETGITFTGDLAYDEWARLMETMQRLYTSFQFGLGDVLNYGEAKYGEKYSQALDSTNAAYQSLANYAWVSKAVPIENRVTGLSWTHHRVAASLNYDNQRRTLQLAASQNMTVQELIYHIKGEPKEEERKPVKQINVPDGWTVDDVNKALELISTTPIPVTDVYNAGLAKLSEDDDVKRVRYCDQCPYNN